MIRLIGTIEGGVIFDRALSRLTSASGDLSVPFEKIGEDFREVEKEQFDAEGYGWQDLSPLYKRWKEKHYPGKTKLRLTDGLHTAMTRKGAADNVSDVKPREASFGATGKPAARGRGHQFGRGNLPQRKVIDLREVDKRMFTKTAHTYLVRAAKEAGFTVLA